MKRAMTLITAATLTMIVAFILLVSTLTSSAEPTQAGSPAAAPTAGLAEPAWPVQDQTTDQALNQQIEARFQEREAALQAQVEQRQATLAELDQTSQAQIGRLQAQLFESQTQIDQLSANLPQLQANVAALQQAIQQDDLIYQNEMSKLVDAEAQLRQQLETATAQLNAAYAELAQRQAAAAAIGGGSSGQSHGHEEEGEDRREEQHEEHENDHEEDDD